MPDPIIVSWSELDAGRQCPHKWDLAWQQRWTQPPDDVPRPLAMGTLGHKVMEAHFRTLQGGGDLSDARRAGTDVLATFPHSPWADAIEWIYGRFIERYGADRQWKILGVEERLVVPLDDRFSLKTRIDLIVWDRTRDAVMLVDWKFGSRLLGDRELAFDDQFGLYQAAMSRSGQPVLACIYGQNRTPTKGQVPVKNPDPPLDDWFERIPLYRTDDELQSIIEDALDEFYYLYGLGQGDAPRRPDTDRCKWRCPFTLPCLHGRKHGPHREVELLEAQGFYRYEGRH